MLERTSALEAIVRAQVSLGNEREARDALARLRNLADTVNTSPMRGSALLAQGVVARAFGDQASARTAFEDASDLFQETGLPYETAQATLLIARCLQVMDRDEAAAVNAREALLIAERLGAGGLLRAAYDLLTELGCATDAGPPMFPGLTGRESEILVLIAQGLNNHDIAERLVLSVRTVERHVSNIYLKLGFEGSAARSSATAAALQHGLV